ncbi:hypothetical protein V5F32_04850 [Xanthobacter oligotrophicus]|uniref:Uncharacterized protein n=1 Tax=Xanthobacter oligotrophicus TaxID=2607286 RepID=A0ABW6ZRY8_9HYPH
MGTGWLGWTEAETLDTSMPGIVAAHKGRLAMLKAIFGSGKEEPKGVSAKDGRGVAALLRGMGAKRRG